LDCGRSESKAPSPLRSAGALQKLASGVSTTVGRLAAISLTKIALVSILILLASNVAFGATNIYEIRGTPDLSIYQLNPTSGVLTTVFSGYPGGSSATIAQRPSDGMHFYSINVANGRVYRFNPATPGIAPVALTSTLGGSVPTSLRMAFSPAGVLYYLPDTGVLYTINQTTGVATAGPTITGLGSGGDLAFVGGTLYVINSGRHSRLRCSW
jgi:hypothetical protein